MGQIVRALAVSAVVLVVWSPARAVTFNDLWTVARMEIELFADPGVTGADVGRVVVEIEDGIATLRGTVADVEPLSDDVVKDGVKRALAHEPRLGGAVIRGRVEDGVVTLKGRRERPSVRHEIGASSGPRPWSAVRLPASSSSSGSSPSAAAGGKARAGHDGTLGAAGGDGRASMNAEIGDAAGVIWRYLEGHGETTLTKLKEDTKLSDQRLLLAVGWLARDGKLTLTQEKRTLKVRLHGH